MIIPRHGGFPAWRVVAGILHNFLHLRVHENVFDQNPQQPTTRAKPTTGGRKVSIPPRSDDSGDLAAKGRPAVECLHGSA